MTLSPAALSVTVPASDAAPTRIIDLSVQNVGTLTQVYTSGTYSGSGIDIAGLVWEELSGTILVKFKDPGLLQPGTYNDIITLRACQDPACTSRLQGSPWTIPVAYTVTAVPTKVTFGQGSLAVQGDNTASHASFVDRSVALTVEYPTSVVWARTRVVGEGAVVINAAVDWTSWPSRAAGVLDLTFRPPSTLGAGTYQDTVEVEVCLNQDCSLQAIGSPAAIPVTYEVTGGPIPTINVHWSTGQVTGADLITAETRSPVVQLTLNPSESVHTGVFARHSDPSTGLITGVVERQVARGNQLDSQVGRYDISLKPPATLGSGVFTDTMEFEACFDADCTVPVPGSKYVVSVRVVIRATEGVDFTRHLLPGTGGASDIVWSPANQLLYVSSSVGASHRIIQVEPLSRTVTPGPLLGAENLKHLAVTPDGSYLYAGSRNRPFVYRLSLPALTVDRSVSLGSFSGSTPNLVSDLATVPGLPQSFVVAVGRNDNHGGVYVYDDDVQRPAFVDIDPAQGFEKARWLVPADTAGTFYSQSLGPSFPKKNNMELLSVDANGIGVIASSPTGHEFFYPRPQRAGTRMFTNDGKVLDAATGEILGTVPGLPSWTAFALLTDQLRGRLFVWTEQDQREVVLVYDSNTLQQLSIVPVYPNSSMTGYVNKSMTLWGNDGLALTDGNQVIILSGPAFVN